MSGPDRPIALIGFMGAGKSRIGRGLAEALGWPYVDLDEEVVARSGRSIPQLFESEGERGFRKREAEALAELVGEGQTLVIGCGGGVVTSGAGRKALGRAIVVYLAASEDLLARRLAGETGRPLLDGFEGEERARRIHELLAERRPLYASVADFAVDAGQPPSLVVKRILRELETYARSGTDERDDGTGKAG